MKPVKNRIKITAKKLQNKNKNKNQHTKRSELFIIF